MAEAAPIVLTHYINPQLFWYHDVAVSTTEEYKEIVKLEHGLELYFEKQRKRLCESFNPNCGEKIAVRFLAWKKLIRGRVLEKPNLKECIVWALDYGFPFLTSVKYIFPLPEQFTVQINYVRCGGLAGVWPVEKSYNFIEMRDVFVKKDKWSQRGCDELEKLISDAASVTFTKTFEINGQVWGDLKMINHTGNEIRATDFLIKLNLAMSITENFRLASIKLKTNKILPWLMNDGISKKYRVNKANPFPNNLCENENTNDPCDDFARRKVEAWYARNQMTGRETAALEPIEPNVEATIDDISFDDSISNNKFRAKMVSGAHVDLRALSKAKQKQASEIMPPMPDILAFKMETAGHEPQVNAMSNKSNVSQSTSGGANTNTDLQSQDLSESSFNVLSTRKQKLLEIRRKRAEQLQSRNQTTSTVDSDAFDTSIKYQHLDEMTANDSHLETKMIPSSIGEKCSSTDSDSVVTNSIIRKHMKRRIEKSCNTTNNSNNSNSMRSKSPEISETGKQEKTPAKSSDSKGSPKSEKKGTPKSVVSSTCSSRAEFLLNLRKKQREDSIKELTGHNLKALQKPEMKTPEKTEKPFFELVSSASEKVIKKTPQRPEKSFFELLDSASEKNGQKSSKKKSEGVYAECTMLPVGYDLSNLIHYKNEENHWHRKKSTRLDYVPHDQLTLDDTMDGLKNFSLNDSWSSPQQDVAASLPTLRQGKNNCKTTAKNRNILDTTVPELNDEPLISKLSNRRSDKLKSLIMDNSDGEHKEQETQHQPAKEFESSSSPPPILTQQKRRQLKSPALQMEKIDKILENADHKKQKGDVDILDLDYINSSGSKTDSDSNKEFNFIDESGHQNQNKERVCNISALIESRLKKTKVDLPKARNLIELKSAESSNKKESVETNSKKITSKQCFEITLPISEELQQFGGESMLPTKFIEHLVLAHSKVPLCPLENASHAFFLKEIHDEMQNMRISKMYRLQMYSWPHLLRGNSLFVINPPKSGKTWSYLPAICNLVSYRVQSGTLPETYGPVAILLLPTAVHVEFVSSCCKRLLISQKTRITTVPSFGVRNANEVKIQLLNSCGLLVTTAASLLRMLKDNEQESLIDPARLQHFIIDNMDMMASRSEEDLQTVIKRIFKMCKKINKPHVAKFNLQLIAISSHWDSMMVGMMRRSNQPLLLIGDFLEAAVYGKVEISIKLFASDEKIGAILRFLKNHPVEQERLLIVCNSDADVNKVVKTLTMSSYICIGYESQTPSDSLVTIDEWKNKKVLSSRIVVCTDHTLVELKAQNVQNLIHFSMPTSWTKFTRRFSVLAQVYDNYVAKDFEGAAAEECVARSMILLDEENNMQLPRLIDFMKKHDQLKYIHENILAVSKRIVVEREEERILRGVRMCPVVLEFGECDEPRCDYRHNLTRFDKICARDDIPTSGDIRILILKVFSPTHYSARLLQHKRPETRKWRELRRSNEVCNFGMQLNLHYMDPGHCTQHWPVRINDLCIYKFSEGFHRARILEVPEMERTEIIKTLKVTIRLIDVGTIITSIKSDELLACDDKFRYFPAQAIDIRLLGVVPFDNERTWDMRSTRTVQKWLMTDVKKNECVHASINFSLSDTIWVNNVIVMEQLPTVGQYIYRLNLKRSLVHKNIGMLSSKEHSGVRNIAKEFGILNTTNGSDDGDEEEHDDANANKNVSEDGKGQTKNEANESINLINFSSTDNETFESAVAPSESGKSENWDDNDNNDIEDFNYVEVNNKTRSNEANQNVHEEWCKLPLRQLAPVEIGDEDENGNWSEIYFQCMDMNRCYLECFNKLQHFINEYMEKLRNEEVKPFPESWFVPMQNCLVKYDGQYLRAKLHSIYGEEGQKRVYRFFLCDYACFVTTNAGNLYNDFLYPTTKEIVEFTPYQAVHCTLAAVKWKPYSNVYKVTKDSLFAYAVIQRNRLSLPTTELQMNSYEILLYETSNENDLKCYEMVNKALVKENAATLDPENKHFLDENIRLDRDNTESLNDKRDAQLNVVSFDEFLECIQRSFEENAMDFPEDDNNDKKVTQQDSHNKKNNQQTEMINVIKEAENIISIKPTSIHDSEEELLTDSFDSTSMSQGRNLTPPPALKTLHKRPFTTWYQTDYLLYLVIHTPDISSYSLEVTEDTVFFSTTINGETQALVLNLLGIVQPKFVSHELRGLNVIVRLVKGIYMKWPRLLQQPTKFPWLTYDLNAIDTNEIDSLLPEQCMHLSEDVFNKSKFSMTDSDMDSDDERDLYQTYTPIVNKDDEHDPLADIV